MTHFWMKRTCSPSLKIHQSSSSAHQQPLTKDMSNTSTLNSQLKLLSLMVCIRILKLISEPCNAKRYSILLLSLHRKTPERLMKVSQQSIPRLQSSTRESRMRPLLIRTKSMLTTLFPNFQMICVVLSRTRLFKSVNSSTR